MTTTEVSPTGTSQRAVDYDVVIIGAGVTGIYQLYSLIDTGLSIRVIEAGSGVGGTWYWNRYPLARFDSESYSYGYFFSKELLEEWEWSEHFAGQPETERYLNFVVDKFGLRDYFQFNARGGVGHLRRGGERLDAEHERRDDDSCPLGDRRDRSAVGALLPRHSRPGRFPRGGVPHRAVAEGARRRQGQAGRHDRHRCQRRATPAGHRTGGRFDHGLPAHPELVRAAEQLEDHARGAGRDQGEL